MRSNTWTLLLAFTTFMSCEASNKVQCPSSDYGIYKGKCYITGTRDGSWKTTKTECAKLGLSPLSIRTSEELMHFSDVANSMGLYFLWLGATDIEKEGVFVWEDTGEPVTAEFLELIHLSTNSDAEDCLYLYQTYIESFIGATDCNAVSGLDICMGELNVQDTKTLSQPINTPEPCIQKADIIFLLDASTSIGADNWNYLTQVAANITKYFDVGPDNVRFATTIFNRDPTLQFDLKDHLDHDSLTLALLAISYPGVYGTKTYLALQDIANKNMFGARAGGRDDAPDNLIVMTDGQSDETQKTLGAAANLKEAGVNIVTLGIGSNPSHEELREIASAPEKALDAASSDLREKIMNCIVMTSCLTVEINN